MNIRIFARPRSQAGGQDRQNRAREQARVIPILTALAVAVAPHVPGLPLWITLWCAAMWGYMLVHLKKGWPLPGPWILFFLTFAGISGLLASSGMRIGADAFVGLLALMAAIKPFEMPDHRHRMITILLTYFIIITSLFRSDALVVVLYMFFSVFVTTFALIRVNAPGQRPRASQKLAGLILVQALPLMLILFLAFPRLPGSLLGFQDRSRGKTGFAEQVSPGSVARLARNQDQAFRADFADGLPRADQLYWRGIVLDRYDGKTWRPGPGAARPMPGPHLDSAGNVSQDRSGALAYTILLPPHQSTWLFTLDRPIQGPQWAVLTQSHGLKALRPVTQKSRYQAMSLVPDTRGVWPSDPTPHRTARPNAVQAMAGQIIARAGHANPLTRNLALELSRNLVTDPGEPPARGKGSARQLADQVLAYFSAQGFSYTLTPPVLSGPDPVDRFLFKTRQGYCEHYASAFALIMNLMGVPARVIGGYLGGELNPIGNFLVIRQSYAHAWAEIFDPSLGWIRVDPTLAVSPGRISTNPDGSSSGSRSAAKGFSFSQKLWFALETVNLKWEAWFTGYSYFEQQQWLNLLGLGRTLSSTAAIFLGLSLAGLLLALGLLARAFRRQARPRDPVARHWQIFAQKLSRAGITPQQGQAPRAFALECMEIRQDLAGQIHSILDLYICLRYKRDCPDTALGEFRSQIKTFDPTPSKRMH